MDRIIHSGLPIKEILAAKEKASQPDSSDSKVEEVFDETTARPVKKKVPPKPHDPFDSSPSGDKDSSVKVVSPLVKNQEPVDRESSSTPINWEECASEDSKEKAPLLKLKPLDFLPVSATQNAPSNAKGPKPIQTGLAAGVSPKVPFSKSDYKFDMSCDITKACSEVLPQIMDLMWSSYHSEDSAEKLFLHLDQGTYTIDFDIGNFSVVSKAGVKTIDLPASITAVIDGQEPSALEECDDSTAGIVFNMDKLQPLSAPTSKQRRLNKRALERGEITVVETAKWIGTIPGISTQQLITVQQAAVAAYPGAKVQCKAIKSLQGTVFEATLSKFKSAKPLSCTSTASGQWAGCYQQVDWLCYVYTRRL
jgi:hypothetical protein